jgi:glycosyltransferase involved in cell wall biosynthesis
MSRTQSKRRALFISITDNPGGAERVTYGLASELASRPEWTVEVMIACSAVGGSFSSHVLPSGIRVSYGPSRNQFLAFPLLPFRLLFRRRDLVFTSHIYTNALVSMMRRLSLIRTGRLVMRESMSLFERFSGVKAKLFAFLYRWYGGEDLLIAQTGYMADHVRPGLPRRSADRLRSLPNPVDLNAIRRGAAEPLEPALRSRLHGRQSILFCGRFVDFKRPQLALEVFHLLKVQGAQVQLVFVGAGPLEAATRERAVGLGIADDVLFLGQRPNPYPVMAACQYGLLTSSNEGFPNVVLEMMACGMRGIVVTPCAAELDTLTGVAVTRSHEASEIAAAMGDILHSPEDLGPVYRSAVASRSARDYVDTVLGAAD